MVNEVDILVLVRLLRAAQVEEPLRARLPLPLRAARVGVLPTNTEKLPTFLFGQRTRTAAVLYQLALLFIWDSNLLKASPDAPLEHASDFSVVLDPIVLELCLFLLLLLLLLLSRRISVSRIAHSCSARPMLYSDCDSIDISGETAIRQLARRA